MINSNAHILFKDISRFFWYKTSGQKHLISGHNFGTTVVVLISKNNEHFKEITARDLTRSKLKLCPCTPTSNLGLVDTLLTCLCSGFHLFHYYFNHKEETQISWTLTQLRVG